MLKEMVIFLVEQLVVHPDKIQVQETEGQQGKTLKLSVAKDDIGRVIGKDGQTIKSLRSMVGLFKTTSEPFVDVTIDS